MFLNILGILLLLFFFFIAIPLAYDLVPDLLNQWKEMIKQIKGDYKK